MAIILVPYIYLFPQIENLVRYHLKQHGENFAFKLRAIFCDPFGPNLRNELAHGPIGYEESQNIYSIYAWWLVFRLIVNTFWNTDRAN